MYIADTNNDVIERVTPAGILSIVAGTGQEGPPTPGPATSSDLSIPCGVAVDPHTGDLYIADSNNMEVEQVTPTGNLSIVAGTGRQGAPTAGAATRSRLYLPLGVAVDPRTGDLYIADTDNDVIEQVSRADILSIVAGKGRQGRPTPGPAIRSKLDQPTGVAVNPRTGDLYIADNAANQIEQVSPAGILSIIAGTGRHGPPTPGPATSSELFRPAGVAVDPDTDALYIADTDNEVIERVGDATRLGPARR